MKALRALPIALLLCLFVSSAAPRSANAQLSPLDPSGGSVMTPADPDLPSGLSSGTTQDFQRVVDFAKTFWPRLALASWLAPSGQHAPAIRWVSPARWHRLAS